MASIEDSRNSSIPTETPKLKQELKSRHVTMIAIGGIIGAGLFVGSGAAISTVGPAVVLSYLLAGVIVVAVMRMLGEMAVAAPEVGSFTEFARLGLGDWAGFMNGWLYWYFWVVVVAIEAIAGATIIHGWIDLPIWQIGLVLMAGLTIVNLWSSKSFGEFEFWFASVKVGAIIAFIVIAAAYSLGITAPDGPTFSNLFVHGGFAPKGITSVFAGVTGVIFSLVGAEIATIAAAESKDFKGVASRMTGNIIVRILIFYVLSVLLIVCVMPWNEIVPGTSPFAAALTRTGIPAAGVIMNFVVLTAVLSCLNSGLYVTSRVLFVLAAKQDAPAALVRLNKRHVPSGAILAGTSFGYLAVIVSVLSPEVVFAFLVNTSGALMLIVYMITAIAQFRLRRQWERDCPEKLSLKMWLYPWGTLTTIAGMLVIMLAMALTPGLRAELYSSLVCVAVVGGAYILVRAKRSQSS